MRTTELVIKERCAPKILNIITPAPREIWQDLLRRDPEAIPYQAPQWLDCICKIGGYKDASRFYEFSGGQQLVLPMVCRNILPGFLSTYASLPPAWGIGGLIASKPITPEQVAAVFDDLGQLPALQVTIRPNPRASDLWAAAQPSGVVTVPRRAHVIDLEDSFGKVWSKQFKKATRNRIRKAERSGVIVESDTTGRLIPVFYELLFRSFDRWANQQNEPIFLARWRGQRRDPLHKFQHIAQTLGEACRVSVAWHNGRAVAAMLMIQYGNVNDARGAMDKGLAAPVCANDLLQKLAIEEACRAGCRYYHLGESGQSQGLAHYKERFGAKPYDYAEYRLERLPVTQLDQQLRGVVKQLIGFRDVPTGAQ